MGDRTSTAVMTPRQFEDFYRLHSEAVRRALCLALGDADLGTDAAAEAMARAYERWNNVSGYDNPVGWAYRVGLNWARSHQRRRHRWRDRRPVPDDGYVPIPGDPQLAEALAQLNTAQRSVVVCRYYLDWSVEDTAAALEIPTGTVKSRLARSLKTLQSLLEDQR